MSHHAEFMAVLPEDVRAKVKALHADDSLGHLERFDKVSDLILSLPKDNQDRLLALPQPPSNASVPAELQAKFDGIHKLPTLKERFAKTREVIASLPEEVRDKIRAEIKSKMGL
ncbi:unnamed protein product, partial [Mesorhabditis spiculigera]